MQSGPLIGAALQPGGTSIGQVESTRKRSQSAWKENKQNFEHAEMFVHTNADAINEKMKAATIEAEKAEAKAIEA